MGATDMKNDTLQLFGGPLDGAMASLAALHDGEFTVPVTMEIEKNEPFAEVGVEGTWRIKTEADPLFANLVYVRTGPDAARYVGVDK